MLHTPGRQISGLLPNSGSRTTLTQIPPCRLFFVTSFLLPRPCRLYFVASSLLLLLCCLFFVASSFSSLPYCFFLIASSLSPHLARFLARPVGRPCFCFAESWIVGLVMGGVESRGADVTVSFSRWSLWKVLTIFRRCMTVKKGSQVFSSSG